MNKLALLGVVVGMQHVAIAAPRPTLGDAITSALALAQTHTVPDATVVTARVPLGGELGVRLGVDLDEARLAAGVERRRAGVTLGAQVLSPTLQQGTSPADTLARYEQTDGVEVIVAIGFQTR